MAHRDDPRLRYDEELDRLERVTGDGEPENVDGPGQLRGDVSEADAAAIREVLDALDPEQPAKVFQANGQGTETKEYKTLANYTARLRLAATELDGELLGQTTDSINQLMGDMASGDAEIAPDKGYTSGTVGQYQSALKALYRYHDDHDVDPEEIPVFAPEDTSVDERDMFTVDEVQAMRDATESPRERCLFELLAYTGQRIRAIQTLRIKDIDLDDGVLYLNENVDGMKGAKGKRPLLGADAYVRRWLDYHPTKEPDDYLITPKATGGGEPGGMITQDTIRYHLKKIADKADVEKDVHPHIFRHYFTTIAKRDYDLDDAYIKHLRGDSPGSNVMETTYRHLSDADAVEHADAKFEGREPEKNSALTPETCPTCGEILEPNAKACSICGTVFTPDAKSAKEQIKNTVQDAKDEAETLDEHKDLDRLERLVDENPELLDVLEGLVED
ncbi:tyrosine-type recombinase/integrase [Halorubellus sp. JP-L1]|uniref:tyrosine-type recombinase/integrase n=1 Tax=Halorubellus sp. JP-L1 TaxID=2715753 RepID=UPI0014093F41|nr:tyrosine-type recombinase/integrase [Halorubellus sp. JP-L1]NHN41818.1 tyrosine-type recombinase/integrase [Halorubellus sp. JP-L1]